MLRIANFPPKTIKYLSLREISSNIITNGFLYYGFYNAIICIDDSRPEYINKDVWIKKDTIYSVKDFQFTSNGIIGTVIVRELLPLIIPIDVNKFKSLFIYAN